METDEQKLEKLRERGGPDKGTLAASAFTMWEDAQKRAQMRQQRIQELNSMVAQETRALNQEIGTIRGLAQVLLAHEETRSGIAACEEKKELNDHHRPDKK